jgi:peptidyl-prolyl cis-trans isomerase A (cyclophilin A)
MTDPQVLLETPGGSIIVALRIARAPKSAAHFLEFVRSGYLERNCGIYRVVNHANCAREPTIDVVQFGWIPAIKGESPPLPPVAHEPTTVTGLLHTDGTLSLARLEPGTGTSAFFFCVGNQPALDAGGGRAEDGAGFAAFGHVTAGRDVLHALHARAGSTEWLTSPWPIRGRITAPAGG